MVIGMPVSICSCANPQCAIYGCSAQRHPDAERTFPTPVAQGWLCPRCKRVNAPDTPQCFCKPEGE